MGERGLRGVVRDVVIGLGRALVQERGRRGEPMQAQWSCWRGVLNHIGGRMVGLPRSY
ncbi:hypothetical protein [Nocardioides immobilis]|uniref:hypothetical protein n=1 Tax=Nocardioides immobilis TaxID=2049295 RepID=UPI0015F8825B|nr:hypothetical protein [Nocardioides immobilis]